MQALHLFGVLLSSHYCLSGCLHILKNLVHGSPKISWKLKGFSTGHVVPSKLNYLPNFGAGVYIEYTVKVKLDELGI